MLGAADSEDPA